ncbi:hypothetical protein [Carboxylicivirga sp. M1479]|uniref:hypothetical protein n=1 Tax=Carboxylicivirga sp. M1479 TaxID=2594476 RepID=UPI001177DBF5|nr:hypothetical protein [Carboxylicivirga sp. M1479]TRX71522.1 hypothetical protein FNN09_06005 [Carboxylicivirga sp. M1479]
MIATTLNLKKILDKGDLYDSFVKQTESNGHIERNEVFVSEIPERYRYVREKLLLSIENDTIKLITKQQRQQILQHYTSLYQNVANVNHVIDQLGMLRQIIITSGLDNMSKTTDDYLTEAKEINKTRKNYQKSIREIEQAKESLRYIAQSRLKLDSLLIDLGNDTKDVSKLETEINSVVKKSKLSFDEVVKTEELIKSELKAAEEKRLKIETFAKNISNYEKQIEGMHNSIVEVVGKENKINELIEKAETALDLKHAEGIAASFISRYTEAKNSYILGAWIGGAIGLIVVATILTIVIATASYEEGLKWIPQLVGKVTAIGISIAGATFCSKRYIKQKNIAEDYAYKATLAKSIIAFTREIQKRGSDESVSEYLTKVLTEIHKDPLRDRNEDESGALTFDSVGVVERILKAASSYVGKNGEEKKVKNPHEN